MTSTMSWNDERVEILKKLWTEGLSASQIAGRIGGVSRNAVIGKVRLGLSGRATTSRLKSSRPRLRLANANQAKRPMKPRFANVGNTALRALYQPDAEPFIPAEELDIPLAERKTIATMSECNCRWPIGDPQMADFHFCNRDKVAGLPYCEFHARRAFQPPQVRRRDREYVPMPIVASPAIAAPVSAEPEKADA
jgi:GcrA cell cycle regulator